MGALKGWDFSHFSIKAFSLSPFFLLNNFPMLLKNIEIAFQSGGRERHSLRLFSCLQNNILGGEREREKAEDQGKPLLPPPQYKPLPPPRLDRGAAFRRNGLVDSTQPAFLSPPRQVSFLTCYLRSWLPNAPDFCLAGACFLLLLGGIGDSPVRPPSLPGC